jgi:hypothetical protein
MDVQIVIAISPGRSLTISGPLPITKGEWRAFCAALEAMYPGFVE